MSRVQEAAQIVAEEADLQFAAAAAGNTSAAKDWTELRQKEFWKPFRARVLGIICTKLKLSRQNSTATAYLNAAAQQFSGGVRKRAKGGGRKHKVIVAPPSKREIAAAVHMVSGTTFIPAVNPNAFGKVMI